MPRVFRKLLLLVAAAVTLAHAAEVIQDEACVGGSDANLLASVPRLDLKTFQVASPQWGEHAELFACKDDLDEKGNPDGTRTCEIRQICKEGEANADCAQQDDDTLAYTRGMLLWLVIAFAGCIGPLLIAMCCGVCRYCCCCCCRKSQACKCGGKYPTRKNTFLGYSRQTVKGSSSDTSNYNAFALVYELNGTQGVPDTALSVVKSGKPFETLTRNLVPVAEELLIDTASLVIGPFLVDLNETIHNGTNIRQLQTDLVCIRDGIRDFPEVSAIRAEINTVQNQTDALDDALEAVQGNLTAVDTQLQSLQSQSDDISVVIDTFEGQADNLTAAIQQLTTTLDNVEAIQTLFADEDTGIAVVVKEDMDTTVAEYPSSAELTSIQDDTDNMHDGTYEGDTAPLSAARLDLKARIDAVAEAFFNMPNFTTTASNMAAFNDAADDTRSADGALQTVFNDLDRAREALDAVYSTAFLNDTFNAFVDTAQSLQLSALNDSLLATQAAIDAVSFNGLRALRDEVAEVQDVIPCMDSAAHEILGVNDTLVSLPDEFKNITTLSSELNDTLHPTLQDFDEVIVDLDVAEAELDNVTVSEFTDEITSGQQSIDDGIATLDIQGLYDDLEDIDTTIDVDFAVESDVDEFNSTLATAHIDEAIISDVADLEDVRQDVISLLGTASLYIEIFDRGVCNSNNVTLCTNDNDCTSGGGPGGRCINVGVPSCASDRGTYCGVTNPNDCGHPASSDECVARQGFWDSVAALVGSLDGAIDLNALDAVSSSMQGVNDTAAFDLEPLRADLVSALDAVDAVDVADLRAANDDVVAGLADVDVADYTASVQDARDELAAVDYSSVDAELADFEGTVEDFRGDSLDNVEDALSGVDAAAGIVYDRMFHYLNVLTRSNLEAANTQSGLQGIVREILRIADDATAFLNRTTTYMDEDDITTLEDDADDFYNLMDVLSLSNPADGSLHFFGSLFTTYTVDIDKSMPKFYVVPADDPTTNTVFTNTNGDKYPRTQGGEAHYCLTDRCLKNWIDKLFKEPLSDLEDEEVNASFGSPDVATIENTMRAALIFPALVVLLGVWALACMGCCCRQKPKWQKVPMSWFAGCSMCVGPIMFLFAGLAFFFTMTLHDTCLSAPNLGLQYVEGLGDSLCTATSNSEGFGGSGTLTNCFVEKEVITRSSPTLSTAVRFTVDIRALYVALVTSCPEDDPFAPIYDGLASSLRLLPRNELEVLLEDLDEDDGLEFKLRPKLKDVLRKGAFNLGESTFNFVNNVGNAWNCEALNPAMNVVRDRMCCDFLDQLYWLAMPLYVIAFALCCCGSCGGLLARKRLTKLPWGKHYEDDTSVTPHVAAAEVAVQSASGFVDPSMYHQDPKGNANAYYGDGAAAGADGAQHPGMGQQGDPAADPGYGQYGAYPNAQAAPTQPYGGPEDYYGPHAHAHDEDTGNTAVI